MSLASYLLKKGYQKKKLKFTKTNHFKVTARINGVKGKFIVDTGASNTCVDFLFVDKFKLTTTKSNVKAAGAGATDMNTLLAENNTILIGQWEAFATPLVLFNLTHVNTALTNHGSKPVHGIIGADILLKEKAVIDYKTNTLFLKQKATM